MNSVRVIIDACASIWSHSINLCGYNIRLMNLFVWGILCIVCFKIINWFS